MHSLRRSGKEERAVVESRRDQREVALRPSGLAGHLLHRALARPLFRPPAQELRAVAETALREIVVLDFADQLRPQRLPFRAFLARPSRRAAGNAHFERILAAQRFELPRQRVAFVFFVAGAVAEVDEASFVLVQAEEERADGASALAVAEAADDAVCGLQVFDLDHALPIAGGIRLPQGPGHTPLQ